MQSTFIDLIFTEHLLCTYLQFIQLKVPVFDYETFVDRS